MLDLFFFHGMESSPKGIKARMLKERYPSCQIPELPPDIHQRAEILEKIIKHPSFLIGSSLGGLSALLYSMKHPDLVKKMILLAPAVGFYDISLFNATDTELIKSTYIPKGIETVVMAGERDDVIPMEDIQSMIERSPDPSMIEFMSVDDEHGLNRFPELLTQLIDQRFFPGS